MVSTDDATEAAGSSRREFLVVALGDDMERGMGVLRNLRNTVRTPIIAVGSAVDPQRILGAMRSGATAYVDIATVDEELEPTILGLRIGHGADTPGGLVVATVGTCGGVGVTTVAANLAAALAQRYGKVAAADLHPFGDDLPMMFDVEPAHTLADLCRNSSRLDKSMFLQSLAWHPSGVGVLAAPRNLQESSIITPDFVRQAMSMARASFPFLVMDIDRSFGMTQRAAIVQADVVLLTTRLDLIAMRNARRVLDQLAAIGVADECIHLVVNQHGRRRELPVGHAEKSLGIEALHVLPFDDANTNGCLNKGNPVVVERPRSKFAKGIVNIAGRIPAPQSPTSSDTPAHGKTWSALRNVAAQYM